MTSGRLPYGVSTVSIPMEPVTSSDIVSLSPGQLSDLHARPGDGVQPAGREALVAFEQSIDGVILLDVAALELEEDDDAVEPDVLVEDVLHALRIRRHHFELLGLRRLPELARRRVGRDVELGDRKRLLLVPHERLGNGRREVAVQHPAHRAGHRIRGGGWRQTGNVVLEKARVAAARDATMIRTRAPSRARAADLSPALQPRRQAPRAGLPRAAVGEPADAGAAVRGAGGDGRPDGARDPGPG